MSRQPNNTFTLWLKRSAKNYGAKDFLCARRERRALPFVPICAFGLKLAEMNDPRLGLEPGVKPSGEGNTD